MQSSTAHSKDCSSESTIKLNENQIALFDIEGPFGNIDHVVVSRDNGVFLILKKAYRGKVEFRDGQLLINDKPPEKDFITEALQNAHWFAHKLQHTVGVKTQVMPIIAFTRTAVPAGIQINGIPVICFGELADILNQQRFDILGNGELWQNRSKLLAMSRPVKTPNVLAPV
ncbi:MAG: NERD domain-containing protein [Chlorobiales bacterium]|jgi:hypothetical protein|nr:NERD domain-containing protein [Chlorobiales bacterium]